MAARYGHIDVVQLLLDHGADKNASQRRGYKYVKRAKQAKEVQRAFVGNLNEEGHLNYTQCAHAR